MRAGVNPASPPRHIHAMRSGQSPARRTGGLTARFAGFAPQTPQVSALCSTTDHMRLLIIRHAIAVPRGTADIPDDERPLTKRGRRRFRTAAAGLARVVKRPDFVLSSPLPRARETAEIA